MASAISQTPNGSHSGSLARRARGTAFHSGSPGLRREFSSGRNLTGNSLGWNFQGNLSDEFFGRIMLRLGTGWSSRWRFLLRISSGKSPMEILKILHAKFLPTWQSTLSTARSLDLRFSSLNLECRNCRKGLSLKPEIIGRFSARMFSLNTSWTWSNISTALIDLYPALSSSNHLYPILTIYLYPALSNHLHLYLSPALSNHLHLYPVLSSSIHLLVSSSGSPTSPTQFQKRIFPNFWTNVGRLLALHTGSSSWPPVRRLR